MTAGTARHGSAAGWRRHRRTGSARSARRPPHHVLDDLGGLLDPSRDLILDGGPCPVGVESTIVDLTVEPPQVLRAGAIEPTDDRAAPRATDRRAPTGRAGRAGCSHRTTHPIAGSCSSNEPRDARRRCSGGRCSGRASRGARPDRRRRRRGPAPLRRPPRRRSPRDSRRSSSSCRHRPASGSRSATASRRQRRTVRARPVEPIEFVDDQLTHLVEVGRRIPRLGRDVDAHGRRAGIGDQLEPTPPRIGSTSATSSTYGGSSSTTSPSAAPARSSPSKASAGNASIVNDGWSPRAVFDAARSRLAVWPEMASPSCRRRRVDRRRRECPICCVVDPLHRLDAAADVGVCQLGESTSGRIDLVRAGVGRQTQFGPRVTHTRPMRRPAERRPVCRRDTHCTVTKRSSGWLYPPSKCTYPGGPNT